MLGTRQRVAARAHLAGLQGFAPFFMGTGKDRYQWLAMNHLSGHARMPDSDVTILARMTSVSWEDHPFANVALDECMEMFSRIKDPTDCGNYRGISLVAYAGKVLLKIVALRLG